MSESAHSFVANTSNNVDINDTFKQVKMNDKLDNSVNVVINFLDESKTVFQIHVSINVCE